MRLVLILNLALALLTWPCLSEAKAVRLKASQVAVVNTIVQAADLAGVPRELLLAVCWVESSYRTKHVTHIDGDSPSYGICQVKLETAEHMDVTFKHRIPASPERLSKPWINAFYAAKYLRFQLNRYDGDWKRAIDAYNRGHHENSDSEYVRKVTVALKARTE